MQKFRLTLTIPGMQEQMQFDMTPEVAPDTKTQERWEMEETWVAVTADSMRLSKGETDGRAWAVVSFNATKVEELTQQRQELVHARKASKAQKKQKAAEAKAARKAAKQADKAA